MNIRDGRFGTRFSIPGFRIEKLNPGINPVIRNSTNSCDLGNKMYNRLKNKQF